MKIKEYIKFNWFLLVILAIPMFLFFFGIIYNLNDKNVNSEVLTSQNEDILGASGSYRGSWVMFDRFDGYQTKADPQKITQGANPTGQNTYINDGDRISIRNFGYEIFPSGIETSTSTNPITSIYTFRKRDGTNIILRTYDDELEYYHNNIGRWERLNNGYTVNKKFGFVAQNTNTDQTSYIYFGNAYEPYSRWTGNVAKLSSAVTIGNTTINVDDTTLFPSSGSVIFCGTETAYSAKTATTFTITASTIDCDTDRGVAQVVEEFPANPRGNLFALWNTRVFVSGSTSSPSILYYSKTADATDFTYTVPRTAEDGGLINMPEGGGGIVGMALDEEVLYVFKRNIIKSVTFTQDGNDLPVIKPLKPNDNKSQTVGAINGDSIFAGGNGIFFITPNNEIMNLRRVANIDYPQVIPISDSIKPTTDGMYLQDSTGVYWKHKAYFSTKQTNTSNTKNVILIYNTIKNAWESPIIGFNASQFTIAKFGTENDELYFGDDIQTNVFKVISTPNDNGFNVKSSWRSREETFGSPEKLKSIDNFYIEGYIKDNTDITISLLLDEDGYTQSYSTTFYGTDTSYLYSASSYNVFGLNPYGYERFGNNDDFSGKKKFRIYYPLQRIPFYSLQLEVGSEGINQEWEILQYGYHVIPETQETKSSLYNNF